MPKRYPFLKNLEKLIEEVKETNDGHKKIRKKYMLGASQISKKMGEEAVEMVIASSKKSDEEFLGEAADLFFYYLLSLHDRGFALRDVMLILKERYNN